MDNAPARNGHIERSTTALVIGLSAGALALASPIAAFAALALLGVRVLMQRASARVSPLAIAIPALAALATGAFFGLAAAIGVLFAARLVVDARWSMDEAERLAASAGKAEDGGWLARAPGWLTPAYGLALVAFTAPHMVAGLPLDLPHVPMLVPLVIGFLAAGALFDWAVRRATDWRLGEFAAASALHMLAHHIMFLAAFGLAADVSAGIVAMVAWRLAHAAPLTLPQASFTAVP